VKAASSTDADVLIVGGGPAGSATGTFLRQAGLSVRLFERERFPRFHVGESLIPATLPLLDRLGVGDAVARYGFQVKHGAIFTDQEMRLEHTFYFLKDRPWPTYAYQVRRDEFDTLLLEHARASGVDVRQGAQVERVHLDPDGVRLEGRDDRGVFTARGAFLVDASGREGFIAARAGTRERIPNLGKVALFAHFRGAHRAPGVDEGNIRIHVFEDGWFWWIPFAGDVTSIGCVLHARTLRDRNGQVEDVFFEMAKRCQRVAEGLAGAQRVTPVHRVANFAYVNRPTIGDRFLAVGDSVAFVDPIFSGGVHIALASAELAARAIAQRFAERRFEVRHLRAYERAVWRGITPFFRFIHKYYEPAFLELFLKPRNYFGMRDAVLTVLAGGAFDRLSWRTRASLTLLFLLTRVKLWSRRRAGLPVESRLEW
jgi:flavin-dependent dehydrogenase